MDQLALANVLKKINELPSLPVVTNRVIEMTDNLEVPAQKVCEVISRDQVLTSKILKLVNSAYYGLPRRISTLTEAVTILGMETIRTLAIGISAFRAFGQGAGVKGLSAVKVLQHSVACATAAKIIARKTGFPMTEQAFLAGLLHDIGKLVMMNFLKDEYTMVVEKTNTEEINLIRAETEVLGIDHAQLGKMLAEKWNLPDILKEPIAGHHKPKPDSEHLMITQIVHLANAVAVSAGYGLGNERDYFLDLSSLQDVGLSFDTLMTLIPEIRGQIPSDILR
ncbi:MAG: HDOD domain-containing protein [Bacillota bacterium]